MKPRIAMKLYQTFRYLWSAAAFALAALLAAGCGDEREPNLVESRSEPVAVSNPAPRLALLYAPCSVGKKFLSPWNESLTFTPNLAKFAAEATVFDRHQTETGQSGISYASIFSGSQANHHQVYRHPATLADDLYLIAEAYAEAGYETFYWNGHAMASGPLNYAQGVPPENVIATGLTANDKRFVEILDKIARDPKYKALIITNFTVTHGPYRMQHVDGFMRQYPAETLGVTHADIKRYARRYRKNHLALTWNHSATLDRLGVNDDLPKFASVIEVLYRANISYLDRLFGDVLHAITSRNLLDESLIVFTADHGEVLYRDSATFQWTHSMLLDHEVLGVPLIVHSPRVSNSIARVPGVTRSTDVFPTMAGLSGITLPEDRGIEGTDLSRMLTSGRSIEGALAYSHTTVLVESVFKQMYDKRFEDRWLEARQFFPDDGVDRLWVAVRAGDQWFKHRVLGDGSWATQAFDLATDPDARLDIFDERDVHHAEMRDNLLAYKQMLIQNYGQEGPADNRLPDNSEAELLRGLGYIE